MEGSSNKIVLVIIAVAVIGVLVVGLIGAGVFFFFFVGSNVLEPPSAQAGMTSQDKYTCALQGIELVGYNSLPMTIGEAKNVKIEYYGLEETMVCSSTAKPAAEASCVVGGDQKFELTYGDGKCYAEAV